MNDSSKQVNRMLPFTRPCIDEDTIEAFSAGSRPSGRVNPKAIEAMQELGYDMRQHFPKGLSDLPDAEFDVAVIMCDDGCPGLMAKRWEHWNIPVPKWMPPVSQLPD